MILHDSPEGFGQYDEKQQEAFGQLLESADFTPGMIQSVAQEVGITVTSELLDEFDRLGVEWTKGPRCFMRAAAAQEPFDQLYVAVTPWKVPSQWVEPNRAWQITLNFYQSQVREEDRQGRVIIEDHMWHPWRRTIDTRTEWLPESPGLGGYQARDGYPPLIKLSTEGYFSLYAGKDYTPHFPVPHPWHGEKRTTSFRGYAAEVGSLQQIFGSLSSEHVLPAQPSDLLGSQ